MDKSLRKILGNIYIYLIGFSTLPLLYFTVSTIRPGDIPEILFWVALEVATDLKPFRVLYKPQMDMTMSFAVQLAAIILLGTGQALWAIIIATFIVEIISKRPWQRVIFNVGQYGLSLLITGFFFHYFRLSPQNGPIDIIVDMPAILSSVTAYFILNTFFIAAVISLTAGDNFLDIFFSDFKIIAGYFYTLAPISLAVALLYRHDRPYIVLIMIPPLIMADQALRRYYSLQHEAQETLRVLATTLDERDKYTYYHSIHVAEYARKIAEQLSLSQEEISEIEMAGHVHDLGKVAISDDILNKNGKLDDEEYAKVKRHPEIAYRLLKNLKPYKKCAEYVLYHHERIDGSGYPKKISGKSIPLGARILSIADSYDAMTTDRPYRQALPQADAVNELRLCAGTQFDAKLIETFITVLKNDYGFTEELT